MSQAYCRRASVWVSLTFVPVSARYVCSTGATGTGERNCSGWPFRAQEVRRRGGSEDGRRGLSGGSPGSLAFECGHLGACWHGRTISETLCPFFSFQQKICGIWRKKKKRKLLGLECKTTGLFKKVFIFLQSLFFFQWEPRRPLTPASAGAGRSGEMAVWGRSLLMGPAGPGGMGSDSHVFLRGAHAAAGGFV